MTYPPLVRIYYGQGGIFLPKKLPIFYSALMLTGVNLLLRLVSTSFQVYISGRIGAAGIGLLQLVMSVGSLALTAGMAGARTATMYLTAGELGRKKPQNVCHVLSGCFLYSILFSGAVSIALYIFAPFLAENWIGNIETVSAIRLFSFTVPVSCLCGVMTGYFTAANRIGTLAAVEVAEQLVSMAVTMSILILWAGHDPAKACCSIILGSCISTCLTLLCLVVLRLREHALTSAKFPIQSQLLQTALPLALADDLRAGISTTENLMVPKRLMLYPAVSNPLAAFGMVCGMVFPVVMFPAAILFALAELLIPELARCAAADSRQRIRYLVRRSLKVSMLYGCIFSGLEFLLSNELCLWLYTSDAASHYLRLYALLIPMLYCDCITDAMTKGLGQQKVCVRYNIITSTMDVILLFLLLPKYGMMGYFFSFFITHLLNFILSLQRLLKLVGNVISPSVPMLSLASMVSAVFIATHVHHPALRSICFILAFTSLMVLLQVVGKEDIAWLRGLVRKQKS